MILQRIQNGLTIASDSFLTIWEHKKLLVYLLVPLLLNLVFGIYSAYDFVYALMSRGASSDFFIVVKAMSKAIIADLGIACVAVHTFSILEHQTSSIRATLNTVAQRAPIIATWSLIAGTFIYLSLGALHMLNVFLHDAGWCMTIETIGYEFNPATILQIVLGVLWIVTVFFMLQILALEKLSLIESFKRSLMLSRAIILEVMGGEFWIGLIWFLSILPFMIIFGKPMAYQLINSKVIHDWSWITIYALIIIGWFCASAQSVFRTKLYHKYYIEPREEEIDVMFYPRF
jgi:hypothetical protein